MILLKIILGSRLQRQKEPKQEIEKVEVQPSDKTPQSPHGENEAETIINEVSDTSLVNKTNEEK